MNRIPLIIDADPGIDDAVALMMAFEAKNLDIKLITCTAGNNTLENITANTLGILDLIGAPEIRIAAGARKPLKRDAFIKLLAQGENGMGGFKFPASSRKVDSAPAWDAMADVIKTSPTPVTICALGPLTNIAHLINAHPDVLAKISKIVMMAGSLYEDGRTAAPYAEFNIACDPEAGEVVLNSGARLVCVPMEMGHKGFLNWEEVFKTREMNIVGDTLENIFRNYRDRHVQNGIAMHDGTAIAYLIDPTIFVEEAAEIKVVYLKEIATGIFQIDLSKNAKNSVLTEINVKKFKKAYFNALKHCKK